MTPRQIEKELNKIAVHFEENVKNAYIDKKICRGGNEPIDSVA